jgi:PIN domain nuclease of toxin-antitoxin system
MSQIYLLDTCAWLDFHLNPDSLSSQTKSLIRSESFLYLSTFSLLEVSRKEASGKLLLSIPITDWLTMATDPRLFHLLDITIPIAVDAYSLPGDFHKDPPDRLIVATARVHQLTIITSDRKTLDYPHVHTLSAR